MSSGDVVYACGCYSFASDCRAPGSGGFCKTHRADTAKMTDDEYYEHWQRISRENKGNPKNWGDA